jgi:hypothetical protein
MERKIGLFSFFAREKGSSPWVPVDRVGGVLQKIRTGFMD